MKVRAPLFRFAAAAVFLQIATAADEKNEPMKDVDDETAAAVKKLVDENPEVLESVIKLFKTQLEPAKELLGEDPAKSSDTASVETKAATDSATNDGKRAAAISLQIGA